MRRSWSVAVAAVLASLPLATAGKAQEQRGEFRVYSENDRYNWFTDHTDRFYTQGLRVEWLYNSGDSGRQFLPGISHGDWCSLLCGDGHIDQLGNVNTGFAIGQNMYTPGDITIAAPQLDDRPWAGLLYGSRIARIRYHDATFGAAREDRVEVSLGVVGPASLAGATQTWWHDDIINADHPEGWHNQLRNEPVVQLRYESALRLEIARDNADMIPRVRVNLGNALASIEGELTARIGVGLTGFGVTTAAPSVPPPIALAEQQSAFSANGWRPRFNVFARAGVKAVAHNITLDGNSFRDNDILVERKPFVPEIAAGVEVNPFGAIWLTYQFVMRGSEFETSGGRDSPVQEFGSITFSVRPGI